MCSKKTGFQAYSWGNQFEPLTLTPSKYLIHWKSYGGRKKNVNLYKLQKQEMTKINKANEKTKEN